MIKYGVIQEPSSVEIREVIKLAISHVKLIFYHIFKQMQAIPIWHAAVRRSNRRQYTPCCTILVRNCHMCNSWSNLYLEHSRNRMQDQLRANKRTIVTHSEGGNSYNSPPFCIISCSMALSADPSLFIDVTLLSRSETPSWTWIVRMKNTNRAPWNFTKLYQICTYTPLWEPRSWPNEVTYLNINPEYSSLMIRLIFIPTDLGLLSKQPFGAPNNDLTSLIYQITMDFQSNVIGLGYQALQSNGWKKKSTCYSFSICS